MRINLNVFSIRQRFSRVLVAGLFSLFFIVCGALLAFVLSPRQALEARRIDRLPVSVAEDVSAAAPGEEILTTGRLEDNVSVAPGGFVAYTRQVWQVKLPTPTSSNNSERDEPTGSWKTVERIAPELALSVDGRTVTILRGDSVTMSGPLHERLIRAYSWWEAEYEGQMLGEGSERVRGFWNGDLITVMGSKASAGGVIPEEMFMGDPVAFVQHKKDSARGLFFFGLCMLGLAPVVLAAGVLSAVFGRR